jgi:hypothetical protein
MILLEMNFLIQNLIMIKKEKLKTIDIIELSIIIIHYFLY